MSSHVDSALLDSDDESDSSALSQTPFIPSPLPLLELHSGDRFPFSVVRNLGFGGCGIVDEVQTQDQELSRISKTFAQKTMFVHTVPIDLIKKEVAIMTKWIKCHDAVPKK
jgi:hypothetical protein